MERAPAGAPAASAPWGELVDAMAVALAEARGARRGERDELYVAILPPLLQVRRVELRGLSDDEAQRVLQRDAASYFPGPAVARIVGVARERGTGDLLAAAAPAALVDAVHAAAAKAGCTAAAIVPAQAAWAAAAGVLWPACRGTCALVAPADGHVEALRVQHGRLVSLRRLPAAPLDASRLASLLGADAGAPVALVGDLPAPLAASLGERGPALLAPTAHAELAASPAALAAAFARDAAGGAPSLVPDHVREAGRRRAMRRAAATYAAAGLLVIAAAALELSGTWRERAQVAGARAALRGRLSGVLATRDSLARVAERLGALRAAEAHAPRWSAAVATVAGALPRDAYVLSLRGEGDSVVIDGVAERAAPVFDALRRAPQVLSVHAQGSIRQEIEEGVGPMERFTLVVRLAAPVAPLGASSPLAVPAATSLAPAPASVPAGVPAGVPVTASAVLPRGGAP